MLFTDLREIGLERLIPKHIERRADGSFVTYDDICASFVPKEIKQESRIYSETYGEPDVFDDEDVYEPDFDELILDEYLYEEEETVEEQDKRNWIESHFETVEDLKDIFELEDIDDDTLANMEVHELLKITKPQLKFLNTDTESIWNLDAFIATVKATDEYPSPEDRLLFAPLFAISSDIYYSSGDKKKYYERLIKADREDYSLALQSCQMFTDYTSTREWLKMNNIAFDEEYFKEFPKISTLVDRHNKLMAIRREEESKIYAKKEKEVNKDLDFTWSLPQYTSLMYQNDQYMVTGPKTYKDFIKEGEVLHHCVGEYLSAHCSQKTSIYFIRLKSRPNEPMYTAEVRPNDMHQNELVQCYGMNNTTEKSVELLNFIHTWCRVKRIKIKCVV